MYLWFLWIKVSHVIVACVLVSNKKYQIIWERERERERDDWVSRNNIIEMWQCVDLKWQRKYIQSLLSAWNYLGVKESQAFLRLTVVDILILTEYDSSIIAQSTNVRFILLRLNSSRRHRFFINDRHLKGCGYSP